jgi:hypothetical protein
VHAVYTCRALTPQQISDLLFAPDEVVVTKAPSSRCLNRMKLLFHSGFLRRTELPHLLAEGRKPFIYQLDRQGAEWVAQEEACDLEDLDWRPGETLEPALSRASLNNQYDPGGNRARHTPPRLYRGSLA